MWSDVNPSNSPLAAIFSLSGPALTDAERALFREANPLGFILFARNCENPRQLRALTDDLKKAVDRNCPILIDQEGGRVQRLRPPLWRDHFPAQRFGDEAGDNMDRALEETRANTLRIAAELLDAGINVNCSPVLDVLRPETHDIIGDRAFSDDPAIVARLGECVCRNFLAAGITPIIKHIPGHGRAVSDSHLELPVVDAPLDELEKTDFAPFRALSRTDVAVASWAMTAHVVYTAIDPDNPATTSPKVIKDIIRGSIGFDGFLLGDDLAMKALDGIGDIRTRTKACLDAGCDAALHCNGDLAEMEQIALMQPLLTPESINRLQKAQEFRKVAA